MVLAFVAWLFSPLSSTLQTVSAAQLLSVTPSSAAPGDWVQVSGSGFTPADGTYGLLEWNTTGGESAGIGRSQEGSDGSLVFDVQVPPTAQPGASFFYVHTITRSNNPETAQVNITVTASTHKIALITPAVATADDDAFKALLDAFSLPTTEIPWTQIKDSDSFSAYDEVLIAADTAAVGATGWGNPAARSALGRFGKLQG